jgi:protein-disulfide isomerase
MSKNIFNFIQNIKTSTPLFVAVSFIALILVGLFFFALKINWQFQTLNNASQNQPQFKQTAHTDPLITPTPNFNTQLAAPLINRDDPSIGPENAVITIIEFSDFECQFCHNQEKIFQNILNEYPEKIKFIWKDYPDYDEKSISFQAAVAARCADEQGKFWEYHDWLYKDQPVLEDQSFVALAKKLELNQSNFEKCLASQNTTDLILNNIYEANALDIRGIPFIFVNQTEVMGEISFQELKQLIDNELNK